MNEAEAISTLLSSRGWTRLSPVQAKVAEAGLLRSDDNFLVIAPTGGGKTGVGELIALFGLGQALPRRVIHVTPLKALADASLEGYKSLLPGRKVMSILETNALRDAEILVATNEMFYRTLLVNREMVAKYSLLILDELHVLYQTARGHTVEKILTIVKKLGIRVVCLSATIENKAELKRWLRAVLVELPEQERTIRLVWSRMPDDDIPTRVIQFDKAPVLLFRSSKPSVESTAIKLSDELRALNGPGHAMDPAIALEAVRERINIEMTERLGQLATCISNGVGWYHADLSPRLKDFVRELYSNRKISYLVSTTALAYGFDSPTRTVVVIDHVRWNGVTQVPIGVQEFRQMAGRAGRPSKSEFNDGFVIGIVRNASDDLALDKYQNGPLDSVVSHLGAIDDYYQKALMEFILGGFDSSQQILDIMTESFYMSVSASNTAVLGIYDATAEIRGHLVRLRDGGYLEVLAKERLRLTKLGEFVTRFQMERFEAFPLQVFSDFSQYLLSFPADTEIAFTRQILYNVARIAEIALPKNGKQPDMETEAKIIQFGWKPGDENARTAMAMLAWMNMRSSTEIEESCAVKVEAIEITAAKLAQDGLEAFIQLSKVHGRRLNPVFDVVGDALAEGVRPELVPLVRIKGVGRKRAKSIVGACNAFVQFVATASAYDRRMEGTPLEYKDKNFAAKGDRITGINCLEFLRRFHSLYGSDETVGMLRREQGIGPAIATSVISLLEKAQVSGEAEFAL